MFSLPDSNFYYLSFFMNTGPGLCLKMLGLYLFTLIFGHKSCNMLSIKRTKLTLQNFETNNVCFFAQIVKTQQQYNKKITAVAFTYG